MVNREDTKNRRVNVLGALNDTGPEPELLWTTVEHRIDAATVLDFVCNHIARLPGGADRLSTSPAGFKRSRPCTIVLDNASIHHADAFKGRREELAAIGVHLFYLPSRSPELNRIERIWRSVKYQDMPVRAYTTAKELHTAVDRALDRRAAAMTPATAQILKITSHGGFGGGSCGKGPGTSPRGLPSGPPPAASTPPPMRTPRTGSPSRQPASSADTPSRTPTRSAPRPTTAS
ncbi:transposase [Streptomyces sp. XH2]|uniref:transposase n=1 Tax=Streptomyces sp. XH2 TaxID=3412483 RepID=UPI003C7B365A